MQRNEVLVAAQSLGLVFPGPMRAIEGLTLEVPRGQFVSIVGPSGCGKSTLLRIVAGLLSPTSGIIRVSGQPPAAARRATVRVSFVFRMPRFCPGAAWPKTSSCPWNSAARPASAGSRWSQKDWPESGWPILRTAIRASCPAACGCGLRLPAR